MLFLYQSAPLLTHTIALDVVIADWPAEGVSWDLLGMLET